MSSDKFILAQQKAARKQLIKTLHKAWKLLEGQSANANFLAEESKLHEIMKVVDSFHGELCNRNSGLW